jgi:hypothetical protein
MVISHAMPAPILVLRGMTLSRTKGAVESNRSVTAVTERAITQMLCRCMQEAYWADRNRSADVHLSSVSLGTTNHDCADLARLAAAGEN